MSIQLAPNNKQGLVLRTPLMAGSGAVAYGDVWPPGLHAQQFGAIVTSPVSVRPRKGATQPRFAELPAGFLFTTAGHNPGFRRVLDRQARLWRHSQVPVILSLAGGYPGDRAWMAAQLEEADVGIAGLELPVPEDVNLGEASAFISAVRHAATLPILVKLPATRAAHLAGPCAVAGADALVVGTPPPAVYPAEGDILLEAPIAGPAAFPFTLRALSRVAALNLAIPLIASGGIHSLDDVALCLEQGASAVQVRSLVWTNPSAVSDLAASVDAFLEVDDDIQG
ncbi:MAG: hypothetical protein GY759_24340 [Chloroflexi bacterium]|nr:hypothetical protein [Chloroflexota bacterium]